eukprot:497802_1
MSIVLRFANITRRRMTSLRPLCTAATMEELVTARKKSDKELIMHVDENNNVIGSVTRQEMRANNLWHRSSFILIFNDKKELYVQKRVLTKDYCPGHFDPCPGGVVDDGENNEDNAYRELKEEMGIDLLNNGQKLKYHGCFGYSEPATTSVWGNLYSCVWNGEIQIQETEVESVQMKTIEQIIAEFKNGVPYCPCSITALYHYIISRDLHQSKL